VSRSEITAASSTPITRLALAKYFTDAGYAVVFQENRGRHGSEGVFVKYLVPAGQQHRYPKLLGQPDRHQLGLPAKLSPHRLPPPILGNTLNSKSTKPAAAQSKATDLQ